MQKDKEMAGSTMNSIGQLSLKNPFVWRTVLFVAGLIIALLFRRGSNYIFLAPQLIILFLHTMYYSMQFSSISGEYLDDHPEERNRMQFQLTLHNKIKEWSHGEIKEKYKYITKMICFNQITLVAIILVFAILSNAQGY
jgi:hypothetical protein